MDRDEMIEQQKAFLDEHLLLERAYVNDLSVADGDTLKNNIPFFQQQLQTYCRKARALLKKEYNYYSENGILTFYGHLNDVGAVIRIMFEEAIKQLIDTIETFQDHLARKAMDLNIGDSLSEEQQQRLDTFIREQLPVPELKGLKDFITKEEINGQPAVQTDDAVLS